MLTLIREPRSTERITAKIERLSIDCERLTDGGPWVAMVYDTGSPTQLRIVGKGTSHDEHEAIAAALRDAAGTAERLNEALAHIEAAGGQLFGGKAGA